MNIRTSRLLVIAIFFSVTACSDSSDYVYKAPAEVEEVGPELWRVVLTEGGASRTGIETVSVGEESIGGSDRLVIPYSSVIYHFDGSTWTYSNPTALTYLREPIEIDYIEGTQAVLNSGPAIGTAVVNVGAAELYGVEFGVGK